MHNVTQAEVFIVDDDTPDISDFDLNDAGFTPEQFLEWRSPRRGKSNPEQLTNPVWDWLIRTRIIAYQANNAFDGPSACSAGPCWCFNRFGQSATELPDGRVLLIAGEHEDNYDPDFYIYNDVVVKHPDGSIDVLGYPEDAFPPTDFHSATLVDGGVVLIGNLGYIEKRDPTATQVLFLDLTTLEVRPVKTADAPPGWIHRHHARISTDGNGIVIERGTLYRGSDKTLIENIDDWVLHTDSWKWERLTRRPWHRWEVVRKDGQRNHLWHIRQALRYRQSNWRDEYEKTMSKLEAELGCQPDVDVATRLYQPPMPHDDLPSNEDESDIYRVCVDGVVVRYAEDWHSIQVTVEGELSAGIIGMLKADLVEKVESLENQGCVVLPIE
ncbi:MAG: hypothetical protein KJ060_08400 [Candidatus Hydrogenedentes bacterium]|nr:hypothetical protein [Candidatus Hydrogenedentota bacterium]